MVTSLTEAQAVGPAADSQGQGSSSSSSETPDGAKQ